MFIRLLKMLAQEFVWYESLEPGCWLCLYKLIVCSHPSVCCFHIHFDWIGALRETRQETADMFVCLFFMYGMIFIYFTYWRLV